MAVIHRPSPHKFIQQACREACREACRAGKSSTVQNTLPHLSQSNLQHLSNQDWNANHHTQVNKSIESPCAKHPDSLNVPYDQASKRRVAMALVDLCTAYMESLWPQRKSRLPLRRFIFEILRRSRVQYPVFQVALCYLARLGPVIKGYAQNQQPIPEILACSRRVLVAALQVASKFLQDRCYSASVWARISGLPLDDLKRNELALMEALNWNLFVSYDAYMHSCRRLRISADSSYLIKAVSPSPRSAPLSTMPTPTCSPTSAPIHAPVSPEIEIWSMN